jgi:hypothetical protein
MPFGKIGRYFFPFLLPLPAIFELIPVLTLIIAITGLLPTAITLAATAATLLLVLWWMLFYVNMKQSPLYALTFPIGAAILFYIFISAILRGHTVAWKDRTYTNVFEA